MLLEERCTRVDPCQHLHVTNGVPSQLSHLLLIALTSCCVPLGLMCCGGLLCGSGLVLAAAVCILASTHAKSIVTIDCHVQPAVPPG